MQKLHLVGFTPDFDGLIFSTRKGAKSGGFVVPLDAGLMKQIAEADRLRDGAAALEKNGRLGSPRLVRPESALSPREMQDRIRAGWSIEEVAAEAGVDLDWVARFASPVLAEMERILDRARATTYQKARAGLSGLPLGAAVRRNVAERSVRLEDDAADDGWSAFQLDEAQWVVRFAYRSRGREQQAEWLYEADADEISSRNRLGSQLAYVARSRRRAAPPPTPARRPAAGSKAAASKAPASKAAQARRAPARRPSPARATAAKRAAPARAAKTTSRANGRAAAPAKATSPRGKAAAKRTAGPRPTKRAKLPAPAPARPAPGISPARPPLIRPMPLPVASPMPPGGNPRPSGVPPRFAPAPLSRPTRPAPAPILPTGRPARPQMPEAGEVEADERPEARGHDWARPAFQPSAPQPSHERADEAPERPIPGAASVDAESGIAHIDSRRNASFVGASPARSGPVFGDAVRAAPRREPLVEPDGQPAPAVRRRTEPLRAR